jgi:hypothetical protein
MLLAKYRLAAFTPVAACAFQHSAPLFTTLQERVVIIIYFIFIFNSPVNASAEKAYERFDNFDVRTELTNVHSLHIAVVACFCSS